ncbi:MAG: hypothetical protein ACQEXJ_11455 [Myxococcota bacterium]
MDRPSTVEPSTAARWMAETDEEITRWLDPAHHTLLPVYLGRADVRHALGEPPEAVLGELAGAGRCWAAHASLYLERWPVHRLRSRRMVPLELAVILGQPALLAAAREIVAVDPMMLLAGTEPAEITEELHALLGGPLDAPPEDETGVAARLGILWWAALSALVRGQREGLDVVVAHAKELSEAVRHRPQARRGGLARLVALHAGLGALSGGRRDDWLRATLRHARLWADETDARLAAATSEEGPCAGALDLGAIALVAAAAAFDAEPLQALRTAADAPYGPALAGYAEALQG